MHFKEAIKALQEGKKVRRSTWSNESYWVLNNKDNLTLIDSRNIMIDDWEIVEDRKVKCIYCKQPIHIDRFGGIKQEGLFCNNTVCLCALIREQEVKENEKRTTD